MHVNTPQHLLPPTKERDSDGVHAKASQNISFGLCVSVCFKRCACARNLSNTYTHASHPPAAAAISNSNSVSILPPPHFTTHLHYTTPPSSIHPSIYTSLPFQPSNKLRRQTRQ